MNQLGHIISISFSVILNSLLRILSHVFYSSHSAYYVWLCLFLKLKSCCLILKCKQHKFQTFQVRSSELQVNNESFQSSVRSACSGFNFSNQSNRIEAARRAGVRPKMASFLSAVFQVSNFKMAALLFA